MFSKRAILLIIVLGLVTMGVSAQQPGVSPAPGVRPGGADYGVLIPQIEAARLEVGPASVHGQMYATSPEDSELGRQCEALVKQLSKAEGQEKDKLKTKLTETIDKQFDLRQKRHESEIALLEAELKKLKEMVQKRQENRKDIVGKRYEQLVRESEGLGW